MADEQPEGAANGGAAQGDAAQEATFTLHTQYIKDMSVENPNAPRVFMEMKEAPEVSVNVDVGASPLQENTYEVRLDATVNAKSGDNTAFAIEVSYGGLVTLENVAENRQREQLLLIQVPQFLFPFVRAIVSGATRDAGFPPLLISPIDFVRLYRERRAQAEAEAAKNAESAQGAASA